MPELDVLTPSGPAAAPAVPECILHFGMYKTGSTAIQQSLFRSLRDPDVRYLHFGRPNSTAALATAFRVRPAAFHLNRKLGRDAAAIAAERARVRSSLREQLEQAGGLRCLMSAESLCGLSEQEFAELAELLGHYTARLRVVGYVRDPQAYLSSDLQQRWQTGTKAFDLHGSWPAYRRRLEKFERVLGAGNVSFWRFERGALAHGCVVRDFCARLGIGFDERDVLRANESLSLPAVQLLFAYRRFGPGFGTGVAAVRANNRLVQRLRTLVGPPFRLHAQLTAPLVNAHREDLEWINARLDAPLGEPAADADEDDTVRGEQDLLRLRPPALEWLAAQSGVAAAWSGESSPRAVAAAMHALRLQLGCAPTRSGGEARA